MEYLKLYHSKVNLSKCILVCEENCQYQELVFLQVSLSPSLLAS